MTPNHEYPLRIPKDLWSDLTAIKEIWNTSHKGLMTGACIDPVKKKQMELPQLRKARTTLHTVVRNI